MKTYICGFPGGAVQDYFLAKQVASCSLSGTLCLE